MLVANITPHSNGGIKTGKDNVSQFFYVLTTLKHSLLNGQAQQLIKTVFENNQKAGVHFVCFF